MKKFFFLLFLVIILHCLFVGRTVAYGDSSSSLGEEINYWRAQNEKLEIEIAKFTSCDQIVQRASVEGWWPSATTTLRTDLDFSVALKR